ncbi:MAG: acyltransferase [Mogibacterium sp.]|nr:acyltransferase [Mogibacterium sp.]
MPSIKAGASGNDLTNTMRDSGKRVSRFSYIRVIACMAIVLLHTMNGARIYHMDTVSQGESLAAFTVCSVLMWAVPCFLMVSGALLLDPAREITWGKIFGKYIRRMLIALILFTAIFTVIRHDPKAGTSTVSEFFNGLAFNHCMAYLWYLYLMITVYLLLPLLRKAAFAMSDKGLWLLSGALIAIAILLQFYLMGSVEGSPAFIGIIASLQLLIGCLAYVFIGRLIFMKRLDSRICIALLVITTVALAVATYKAGQTTDDPSHISAYCSPLVVLQSISIYSLLLGIKAEAGPLIRSADKCTFGIYLIHMIFVRITMSELGVDPFSYGPFGFIFLSAIFFLAAYAVAWTIRNFTGSAII